MKLERTLVHCTSGDYFIATVVLASNMGSFNNSDGEGQLCTSHFLAHFIVVTLRSRREICVRKVWKTQIDDNYFFLFLNLHLVPMNPTPNSPTLVILNEMEWSQRLRKRKSISPLIRTFSFSSQWTTATATATAKNQRHSHSYEGCSKRKTYPLYKRKWCNRTLLFVKSHGYFEFYTMYVQHSTQSIAVQTTERSETGYIKKASQTHQVTHIYVITKNIGLLYNWLKSELCKSKALKAKEVYFPSPLLTSNICTLV